jgi:hypothetical protein
MSFVLPLLIFQIMGDITSNYPLPKYCTNSDTAPLIKLYSYRLVIGYWLLVISQFCGLGNYQYLPLKTDITCLNLRFSKSLDWP